MSSDFSCEKKLAALNPGLHRRYSDSLFASVEVLNNYKAIFPEYTDHSLLHTMNIIEYCNILIGDNLLKMNAGEIYVMLMAAALHDTGMGISEKDYDEFIANPDFTDYLSKSPDIPKQEAIRDLHHELSGLFIKKYSVLFEIPDEFVFPIIQASRGHRKTDLFNRREFPPNFKALGYSICLPYIASLIRLADELDITAERNINLNQNISSISNDYSLTVWKLHSAIKSVTLTERICYITVINSQINDFKEFSLWIRKLRSVIAYVSSVVNDTTEYSLRQRHIKIEYI